MDEFFHACYHALTHTLEETVLLLPFLFLSYLLMEFLEHKAGGATERWLRGSGKVGPLLGSLLGMLPQCGFSAAAAGLYTGRIITSGTLIAVYLSTSDEMLPILISKNADPMLIVKLLGTKVLVGLVAGFAVDLISSFMRKKSGRVQSTQVEELCERERCECGDKFFLSALKHTLYITLFLLLFGFAMNLVIELIGEDRIGALVLNRPVLGSLLAALVGLIPNCAASVALTTLYLDGVISVGAMLSGLLVGAGVGIAILVRNNRPVLDSLRLLLILFGVAVVVGILIDVTPLGGLYNPLG